MYFFQASISNEKFLKKIFKDWSIDKRIHLTAIIFLSQPVIKIQMELYLINYDASKNF